MSFQDLATAAFQYEINSKNDAQANVYILAISDTKKQKFEYEKIIKALAGKSDQEILLGEKKRSIHFAGINGPVWILLESHANKKDHHGLLADSSYGWFRDHCGSIVNHLKNTNCLQVNFVGAKQDVVRACIIGFEMAAYNFLNVYKKSKKKEIKINLKNVKVDKNFIKSAVLEAASVQIARHLVNLPPNLINPQTVEDVVKKDLKFGKNTSIEIWDHKKLAAENMNLHLAVGQGAVELPRMIHLKYRPKNTKKKMKPIAFVGKGITFDTGGLDIKPSSGMRLMKKDMGGAAAVLALAYWVSHSDYKRPCDFYLALAENSVDAKSMRPSDLYTSRAGYLVEIDNTDAEGRLVLADVMDVAVTQTKIDEPEIIIDVATLTGAIKVALGADVAGLFSNDDVLAEQLQKAGQRAGELNWRMPLVDKYFSGMSSNFADFKNSADGFGGAITAALFLEKFCRGKKWAHLDVYCWSDKPTGAIASSGASGQPVQSLIEWLKTKA